MSWFDRLLSTPQNQDKKNPTEAPLAESIPEQSSVEQASDGQVEAGLQRVLGYDRKKQQYTDYERMIEILQQLAEAVGTSPLQPKTSNVADIKQLIDNTAVAIENLSMYRGRPQRVPFKDSLVDTLRQGELESFIERVVNRKTALHEQLQAEVTVIAEIEAKYPVAVERARLMAQSANLKDKTIIETVTKMQSMPKSESKGIR